MTARPDAAEASPYEVVSGVGTDPRLKTLREKCMVLRDLTKWSKAMPPGQYAGSCPKYPIDDFPWD
jgi:hypothetical protein